jgi:hypothetical protein
MTLATISALFGAGGLCLLWQLGDENAYTHADSNAPTTSNVEVEHSGEARTTLALSANSDVHPAFSLPGSVRGAPELTADSSLRIRRRYAELFREMELSEQQIEALVPVLIAQDQPDTEARSGGELRSARDAERERAAISAVLGPDKGLHFDRLKKTLPARMQLSFAREQLEQTGSPLREDQRKRLLAILNAQEPLAPWKRIEGESSEQQFARYRQWQQDGAKRFIEQAAPVLTPEQMKHLEDQAAINASVVPLRPDELGAAGARAPR